MLDYDSSIVHTNLWEYLVEEGWKASWDNMPDKWVKRLKTYRSGKEKNNDYIAPSSYNITHNTGYTLREFTNLYQFLNALRPEVVNGFNFPVELSIGFVNEKTLDKIEFVVNFNDAEVANLEITFSKSLMYNKLKTRYEYGYNTPKKISARVDRERDRNLGKQKATREPIDPDEEPVKPITNLSWTETTKKAIVSTKECHEFCKKIIGKLKKEGYREIEKNEDFWKLIKKFETYTNCKINLMKFNEIFRKDLYENDHDDYLLGIINRPLPSTSIDFRNSESFINYIKPANIVNNSNTVYPLDVFIQFMNKDSGKIVGIWLSYKSPNLQVRNVRMTLYRHEPVIYERTHGQGLRFIRPLSGRNELEEVLNSEDQYVVWRNMDSKKPKFVDLTIEDTYLKMRGYIQKLKQARFLVFEENGDPLKFMLSGMGGNSVGRGRPKGSHRRR